MSLHKKAPLRQLYGQEQQKLTQICNDLRLREMRACFTPPPIPGWQTFTNRTLCTVGS
jgi:hypothetical protein